MTVYCVPQCELLRLLLTKEVGQDATDSVLQLLHYKPDQCLSAAQALELPCCATEMQQEQEQQQQQRQQDAGRRPWWGAPLCRLVIHSMAPRQALVSWINVSVKIYELGNLVVCLASGGSLVRCLFGLAYDVCCFTGCLVCLLLVNR